MTITSVNSATIIADTVNFIRDKFNSNITDPLSASRSGNDRFVMTEYPKRPVKYPIITIVDSGTSQIARLGMQSEETAVRIPIEIRVWASNVKERDTISDEIYNYLRTNQFSGDDFIGANLHDFSMLSTTNVSEEKIKSKILEVSYLFIAS